MNLSEVKTYEAAVSYCLAVPRFTKKNSPKDTGDFFSFLGKPGTQASLVHIAGTNGKGSVSAFLQSICLQTGKKVGMFTSPHLCDIRERIRLNGDMIEKEEFLQSFLLLKDSLFSYWKKFPEKKEYHPTFFEILFFISMLYYEKTKPEILILETGLGGRLDATNVIENPKVCIITKIGYDHMEYLGDSICRIAEEKAGIIKAGIPVVYWKDKEEAAAVIEERAKSLSSPCISVSKDLVDLHFFRDKRIDFSYKSRYYGYIGLSIRTNAFYQTENAALALAASEWLFDKNSLPQIQEGIAGMYWEGRMEEVLPHVFFDGAHNEDGMEAFLYSVKMDSCKGSRSLLFSVVNDKQYRKMADMIIESGLFDVIYTAPLAGERAVPGEELETLFDGGRKVKSYATPREALKDMLDDRRTDDCLYVAGSLYLIGQLKEWLRGVV